MIRGTIRVHTADGSQTFEAGETYYWPPGHNLEAVTDCEYLEVSPAAEYDLLMEHVARAAST
jgi:quercetin dioxygenase-like cupin family protein